MARNKVSEREYINSSGDIVDRIEQATGARYVLGQGQGDNFQAVNQWDLQCGQPGTFTTMCAILGFHTKCGNVANTVLNSEEGGTLEEASAAIDEFVANGGKGIWVERAAGGTPSRYDPEVMLQALLAVTGKPEAELRAKLDWRVDPKTGKQVQAGPDGKFPKGARTYLAFAYANKKVAAEYDKRKPGAGVAVDLL